MIRQWCLWYAMSDNDLEREGLLRMRKAVTTAEALINYFYRGERMLTTASKATPKQAIAGPIAETTPQPPTSGPTVRSTVGPTNRSQPKTKFAMEVARILANHDDDWNNILEPEECTLSAVKSKYRELMLHLHPDKRMESHVNYADGEKACDEAFHRVQRAFEKAEHHFNVHVGKSGVPTSPQQSTPSSPPPPPPTEGYQPQLVPPAEPSEHLSMRRIVTCN